MKEFLDLIREMRNAQKEYFFYRLTDKAPEKLFIAKELEGKVDVQLEIKLKELEKEGIEL